MFILDTDIATLAFHQKPSVLARMEAAQAPIRISIMTRVEFLRGRLAAFQTAKSADELLRATGIDQV